MGAASPIEASGNSPNVRRNAAELPLTNCMSTSHSFLHSLMQTKILRADADNGEAEHQGHRRSRETFQTHW